MGTTHNPLDWHSVALSPTHQTTQSINNPVLNRIHNGALAYVAYTSKFSREEVGTIIYNVEGVPLGSNFGEFDAECL